MLSQLIAVNAAVNSVSLSINADLLRCERMEAYVSENTQKYAN